MSKTSWKKIGMYALFAIHIGILMEIINRPVRSQEALKADKLIIYTDSTKKDSVVYLTNPK